MLNEEQIAAILGRWLAGSFTIRGMDYEAAENHTLKWPDSFSPADQDGFRAVARAIIMAGTALASPDG